MLKKTGERTQKIVLNMDLSHFEIPPAGEALVLGKRAAIGPEAAKRMLDNAAPEEFELIQLEDSVIDGLLVKKSLFLRADKGSLINAIVEEAKAIMGERDMIRLKCEVSV
jgi:hypothetical protein